jgi:hypothetical protein
VAIEQWSDRAVTFLVPTDAFSVEGRWERTLAIGQPAAVTIVTNTGMKSRTLSLMVQSP